MKIDTEVLRRARGILFTRVALRANRCKNVNLRALTLLRLQTIRNLDDITIRRVERLARHHRATLPDK